MEVFVYIYIHIYRHIYICNYSNTDITVCPDDYIERDRDNKRHGLTGSYDASKNKCKADCDKRDDCKAFQHSQSKKQCKLVGDLASDGSKFKDFSFCEKSMCC